MSISKTHKQFIEEIIIKNPNIEILGRYVNNATKIKTRCKIDNHIWHPRPNFLLCGGGCPVCKGVKNAKERRKTKEQYNEELHQVFNGRYVLAGEYVNNLTKVKVRCNICNHTFDTYPTTFLISKGRCPVCSGRVVVKGVNDLWTTHPELASLLTNKDDGYKYSYVTSKVRPSWECPDCGYIKKCTIHNIRSFGFYCPNCDDNISYSEKFMSNLLAQLNVRFKKEKQFEWSDNKFYDFYIPKHSLIIETHGEQHYVESAQFKRNLLEEQANDKYKYELAASNGIKKYVILNCMRSEFDWVKDSILNSDLPTILKFADSDIDWIQCNKFATTSLVKRVYFDYIHNEVSMASLAKKYHLCADTISKYIKRGKELFPNKQQIKL